MAHVYAFKDGCESYNCKTSPRHTLSELKSEVMVIRNYFNVESRVACSTEASHFLVGSLRSQVTQPECPKKLFIFVSQNSVFLF